MKIALGVEYDGQHYLGWQRQNIPNTVQAELEKALSLVANTEIETHCAGRTDAGVHAVQQVVHFETDVIREEHAWVLGGNSNLPKDIAINWAKVVDTEFHARFSAQERTYVYLILNRRSRAGLFHGKVTWECRPLTLSRMQKAANCFIGEHDFTSYRAVACQAKSPIRTIYELNIEKQNDLFLITIRANAFLHHMVRNIAGVLMTIGSGKEKISWAEEVLLAKDRTAGGVTASPDGLYLLDVSYPVHFNIPASPGLLIRNELRE